MFDNGIKRFLKNPSMEIPLATQGDAEELFARAEGGSRGDNTARLIRDDGLFHDFDPIVRFVANGSLAFGHHVRRGRHKKLPFGEIRMPQRPRVDS